MTLKEYIALTGPRNISRLSAELGEHRPDVSRWISGKRRVPIRAAVSIEKFTHGLVTRMDLRPDDYHLIWPELAKRQAKLAQQEANP